MASRWLHSAADKLKRGVLAPLDGPTPGSPPRRSASQGPRRAPPEAPRPEASAAPPADGAPAGPVTPLPSQPLRRSASHGPRRTGPGSPGSPSSPQSPFSPRVPPEGWTCDRCTLLNPPTASVCSACTHSPVSRGSGAAGWPCAACTYQNVTSADACAICNQPRRVPPQGSPRGPSGWRCPRCTCDNGATTDVCDACDRAKDATVTVTRSVVRPPAPVRSGSGWVHSSHLDDQLREQETDAASHISKICAEARAAGTPFVDREFPASRRSIFGEGDGTGHGFRVQGGAPPVYEWKRPSQLATGWVVIDHSINSSDILQGELGDCWFLSALSVLADRPHLIDRILLTKKYNPEGAYAVRVFHDGGWKRVVVDDLFPTKYRQLAFGRGKGKQLWVSILEKAYAKLHGSYAAITGGRAFDALFDLTGAPCEAINFEKEDTDLIMVWGRLLSFQQSNFLMAASCSRKDASEAHFQAVGLVLNHAYSLVDVRAEAGVKLVKLRNPWGRQEWSGDWGRTSKRWTAEWKQRLRYPEDQGTFWMAWADFLLHFQAVDVCKEQVSWYSVSLPSKIPDYPATIPLQMFELTAASATWMFVMLIQPGQRGVQEKMQYPDLAALVLEAGAEGKAGASQCPVATMWPTMNRVGHVDFLTRRDKPNIVLPFSTAVRNASIPLTLAVYSARPVAVRPVPYHGGLLSRHLPISMATHGKLKELAEGIYLSYHTEGTAILVAVVNRDPYHYALVGIDASGSTNLTSSRKKLVTRDVLPPLTRQLVAVFAPKMGTSSCKSNLKLSTKRMNPAFWRAAGSPTHTPKLTGDGDLHRTHPLGGLAAAR